jgi:DNA-binding NtrC family response regulator
MLKGENHMDPNSLLKGKKILVVDDEQDVLESLSELLDMCRIDTASSFEKGKEKLEAESYDIAILDIMGVDGFELLKVANKCGTPALMLTAHGLSEENLKKSAKEGASYYAPKEKMHDIHLFVADVLEAFEKKKSPWNKFFDRLSGFYDKRFHGTDWREQERKFWKEKLNNYM